jgi:hypothetical protein
LHLHEIDAKDKFGVQNPGFLARFYARIFITRLHARMFYADTPTRAFGVGGASLRARVCF